MKKKILSVPVVKTSENVSKLSSSEAAVLFLVKAVRAAGFTDEAAFGALREIIHQQKNPIVVVK
jgi:hypothetical protein